MLSPEREDFGRFGWADPRRGKGRRGGLRVIYYYFMGEQQIWPMTLYDKSEAPFAQRKASFEERH